MRMPSAATRMVFMGALICAGAQPVFAQRAGNILPGSNSRAPISVNAEKLDYFDKEQKLIYSGSVVAKQGDSTLRSSVLTLFMASSPAQGAEPAGGPGNGQVRRMEASGPVTITSKDQVGFGDRGVYDKAENKVYLFGNVSLTQGANVVKGDRDAKLVYDLTTGRARIDGGVSSLFTPGSDDPTKKKPDAKSAVKPKPKP